MTQQEQILDFIRKSETPVTAKNVEEATNISESSVSSALSKLFRQNCISKIQKASGTVLYFSNDEEDVAPGTYEPPVMPYLYSQYRKVIDILLVRMDQASGEKSSLFSNEESFSNLVNLFFLSVRNMLEDLGYDCEN
ncbi:hypothetical protein K5I04_04805 [Murdochiella sp. Marseille-P8839]|nr:hypothetical protein [Murdochiella sp. Marseille-P8839]